MRFHSVLVIRLADAKPIHLGHTIVADSRWRLFLFVGGSGDLGATCAALADMAAAHTPAAAVVIIIINIRAIQQRPY